MCRCCSCDDGFVDVSDSELLNEVRARGLDVEVTLREDRDKLLKDILHDLMAKQHTRAIAGVEDMINALLGDNLREAVAALRDGKWSEATCRIDSELFPSEAARAKRLPPKPPKLPAQLAAEIADLRA